MGSEQDQQNHFQSNVMAEKVLEELTLEGVAKHIKKLQVSDDSECIFVSVYFTAWLHQIQNAKYWF